MRTCSIGLALAVARIGYCSRRLRRRIVPDFPVAGRQLYRGYVFQAQICVFGASIESGARFRPSIGATSCLPVLPCFPWWNYHSSTAPTPGMLWDGHDIKWRTRLSCSSTEACEMPWGMRSDSFHSRFEVELLQIWNQFSELPLSSRLIYRLRLIC